MSVTTIISSSEFASQINLSLDAMKSRLAITNGQTVSNIYKKKSYLSD